MEDPDSKTTKLVAGVKQELRSLITRLNTEILNLDDPYGEALFQLSAEEIARLESLFERYLKFTRFL